MIGIATFTNYISFLFFVIGNCAIEIKKLSENAKMEQHSTKEPFPLSNEGTSEIPTTPELGTTSANKGSNYSNNIRRNVPNEKEIDKEISGSTNKAYFGYISSDDNDDSCLITTSQAEHQVDIDSEIEILSEANNAIEKSTMIYNKQKFFSSKDRVSKKDNDISIETKVKKISILAPLQKKRREKQKTFWEKHTLK